MKVNNYRNKNYKREMIMKNKKIIFQVTKTYMKKNKKRTIITFAGILVMVVLMTAVFIGKDTVMDFMRRAVEADQGKWHYQVYDVTGEEIDEIGKLESVDKLEVSKPLGYTDFPQSVNVETPFLELKGYSGELFDWMNIKVISGRAPENENEILLSERAIKDGADIRVGDTVEVDAFDRYVHAFYMEGEEEKIAAGKEPGEITFGFIFTVKHGDTVKAPAHFAYWPENDEFEEIHKPTGLKGTYKIVGIMETPSYEADGHGGYTALTKTDTSLEDGEVVNIVLTTDLRSDEDTEGEIARIIDSHRTEAERAEIAENGVVHMMKDGTRIPEENGQIIINDMLLVFAAKGTDSNINMLMIFFQVFFIVLISVASLVLIYNVFSMSYKERSRYLGMLSSVGATRQQKKWSVYYEVFVLLAMALPVGIILGLLVVKGGMMLLYPHFSKIISSIATNVISGKSCEIDYHLIVNPINILFVLIFSAIAVWISAWIPAVKISKAGPIESIRGNDDTGVRLRKNGYKTYLGLMLKGRPERLLSAASIGRNRHSTRGIIRSITVFISLTLITAFAVRSFTDIFKSKTNQEDVTVGPRYKGYEYSFMFDSSDAQYYSGRDDIVKSDEVSDYIEMQIELGGYNISLSDYTEEFRTDLNRIIDMYYPEEKPEIVVENFLEPTDIWANPEANIITLSDSDFTEVAKKAGVDISGANPVLVYDTVILSTDEYEFTFEGALKPAYTSYEVKKPLNYKVGEEIHMMYGEYDVKSGEVRKIDIPVTFSGYIDAKDIEEYYSLKGSTLWLIVPESTSEYIRSLTPKKVGIMGIRQMLFNVNTDDSRLIRNLSQLKDEFDNSAIRSASLTTGLTDFLGAITRIVSIVATCFTLLIALICMLNLYNSVMGRRLSRYQELSVLKSMGMTENQKRKMLLLENLRLILKSIIYSGIITGVFVAAIRFVLNRRFGKMSFTLPVWMILLTVAGSVISLLLFTRLCYKDDKNITLIDEVRNELQ